MTDEKLQISFFNDTIHKSDDWKWSLLDYPKKTI